MKKGEFVNLGLSEPELEAVGKLLLLAPLHDKPWHFLYGDEKQAVRRVMVKLRKKGLSARRKAGVPRGTDKRGEGKAARRVGAR